MPSKPDKTISLAYQKRHVFLLEKLKNGTLTPKEIAELEKFERGPEGVDFRNCTQTQILKIFQIDKQTHNRWTSLGCPYHLIESKKHYDPARILEWRINRQKELDKDRQSDDPKNEITRIRAESLQFDLDTKRGKYVDKEYHKRQLRDAALYVRRGLQDLPKRIADQLSKSSNSKECESIVEDAIIQVLERLADE